MIDERSGKRHSEMINFRRMQAFAAHFNILQHMKCGKSQMIPEKIIELGKATARHLGWLKFGFSSADFKGEYMLNANKTYFILNMDSGKTLCLSGDDEVRYSDVKSGGVVISILIKLSCGPTAKF